MENKSLLLRDLRQRLERWKDRAQFYKGKSLAGELDGDHAEEILSDVVSALNYLKAVKQVSGITKLAANELDYQGTDLAADFLAIENSMEATGDWVASQDTNFWNGYDRAATYPWARTLNTFSAAATADLRTALDADIAAIDTFLGNIPSYLK